MISTLQGLLDAAVHAAPERTALRLGEQALTYRQLGEEVAATTGRLRKAGLLPGHVVALLLENTPASVVGFLALAALDVTVVPLGGDVSTTELAAIHDTSRFAALIGSGPLMQRFASPTSEPRWACINLSSGHVLYDVPPPEANHSEGRGFLHHYTSGSTGRPKAALHSQHNLICGAQIYAQTYDLDADDRILCPIPLCHSFGMVVGLVTPLLCGAQLVLIERFSPQLVLQTLAAQRVSILIAVPLIYDMLVRSQMATAYDLAALRLCLSSGAPLPPNTARLFHERYQAPVYQVYGSTETGVIAAQRPGDQQVDGSVGRPLAGVCVRVVGGAGEDLAADTPGTLLVRTPAMFAGYHNEPASTARVLSDGWYNTGDLVRQGADGSLTLVGRKDTFINVGGKKVNPQEVEQVLCAHPAVQAAVVYGGEALGGSQHILATIVLRQPAAESELIAWCRERLPPYKVPYKISRAAKLPTTEMGKVRRADVPTVVEP